MQSVTAVQASAEPQLAPMPEQSADRTATSQLAEHLESVLRADTGRSESRPLDLLQRFLQAESTAESLAVWLGGRVTGDRESLLQRLTRDIAVIDTLLNEQLNAILHHPALQRLEASWRSLFGLVETADEEGCETLKIRVLNATWRELERDFERASEFDRTQLFEKVYSQEFGMPGGQPYGLLIGDYEIHPFLSPEHSHDDLAVLQGINQVAAAALCPFVAGASPAMFEIDDFRQLERFEPQSTMRRTFDQLSFLKWRTLRQSEDARFIGLALPRVLVRKPYADDGSRKDCFRFEEQVLQPDGRNYLWGNAAFAFARLTIRQYARFGWFGDMRGAHRDLEAGGLLSNLTHDSYRTDKPGLVPKPVTNVTIIDQQEKELAEAGFLPLCQCAGTDSAAFYSCQSIQKPHKYAEKAANRNAQISAMLHYMLCVSQFGRLLKVIGRDKIGSVQSAEELQSFLHDWLHNYVVADDSAALDVKARSPLREAKVEVREHPSQPGCYTSIIHLRPHSQLDDISATVKLRAEISPRLI